MSKRVRKIRLTAFFVDSCAHKPALLSMVPIKHSTHHAKTLSSLPTAMTVPRRMNISTTARARTQATTLADPKTSWSM